MKSIVSIAVCNSYDEEKVYGAVKSAIDSLGGIGRYVAPEEKILVKPNFLYPAEADKAVTTNPAVIKAMLRILEEEGYENFKCGDSPATGSCKAAFEKLGLDPKYIAPMDKEVKKDGLWLCEDVVNADAIIGLSKMKTHMLERITGAVKNMYGLICGYRKSAGHVHYPNAVSFAGHLVDIHKATPQRLHIMDAIVAMEGNGPASGSPVEMDLILASTDPVAIDAVFCYLVNLNPKLVPTETAGYAAGLGTYMQEDIQLILYGKDVTWERFIKIFGMPKFDVQRKSQGFSMLGLLSKATKHKLAKPVIDESKCVKCGVCVDHCPVDGGAVTFAGGKDHAPKYDYKKCIRCYCCQEICPQHAISTKGRK